MGEKAVPLLRRRRTRRACISRHLEAAADVSARAWPPC
uniref:F-box protein 24 n=1 Tax=Homo sapiens TaxID=9606 RepID=F8WC52_HUMAN